MSSWLNYVAVQYIGLLPVSTSTTCAVEAWKWKEELNRASEKIGLVENWGPVQTPIFSSAELNPNINKSSPADSDAVLS